MILKKEWLRQLVLGGAFVLLVLSASFPCLAQFEDQKAPDFSLPELSSDTKVSLGDFAGTVIILDFWATWCPTCKQSFPWLDGLQAEFGKESIKVIAVSVDEDANEAKKFIRELAPKSITVLKDPEGTIAELYKIEGMPSTVIINKEGHVAARLSGFSSKERKKIKQTLRRLTRTP